MWRFSEFSKNRIENFIASNYTNYTQKIANSNNSNFWINSIGAPSLFSILMLPTPLAEVTP